VLKSSCTLGASNIWWKETSRCNKAYWFSIGSHEVPEDGLEQPTAQYQYKSHVHRAFVMSLLMYASETWMLLTADIRRLEAFHMRCLRQLLNITWRDHITNEAILATTGLTPLQDILSKQRASLFGHVTWLDPDVRAHHALWMEMDLSTGQKPDVRWRRTLGQPRKTWCSLIWTHVEMSPRNYWDTWIPVATVEWGNGPQGLRDDDDDDE